MAKSAGRVDRRRSRLSQPHQRALSRGLIGAAISFAVVLPGLLLSAGPAQAQESSSDVQSQIDAAWRELEPIIEEHNGIRVELRERKAEAKELAEEIEPLELQLDLARAEVVEIAVRSFKGGHVTPLQALLSTGSPLTFADQLTVLDRFAKGQQEKIERVVEVKEQYQAEKDELDTLVAELAATEEELAERADEIDAEIDRLQDLYDELRAQEQPEPTPTPTGTGSGACPASNPGGAAGTAVQFACAQIGKPYGWGQAGPDAYDCSGLTSAAWSQAGVSLPHNAAQQRNAISYIERSDLRPGDLVFYYSDLSHVGMYAGDGNIVHASRAGVPVRVSPIDQMPIHSYGRPG